MRKARFRWWHPPRSVHEERDEERRVTWLELFHDLVYVVIIAELAHSLSEHVNLKGIGTFVFLFIPVWWAWINGTYYHDLHGTRDISIRIFTFLQMFAVAAMAIFAHDALGETSTGFALAYAAHHSLLIYMWWRAGWHDALHRSITNRYNVGYSVSVLLFVISVFVSVPLRFVLWGVALFTDLITPTASLPLQRDDPAWGIPSASLIERFGLFTIIVLGESIVGVVQGVAEQLPLTVDVGLSGALGMVLAFGLWWTYFDFVFNRPVKPGVGWQVLWTYGHMPMVIGITAVGAGVLNVVAHEGLSLPNEVRWLLTGAITLTLTFIGVLMQIPRIDEAIKRSYRVGTLLLLSAGIAAIAVGVWGGSLTPVTLLTVLLVLMLIPIVYSVYVWLKTRIADELSLT